MDIFRKGIHKNPMVDLLRFSHAVFPFLRQLRLIYLAKELSKTVHDISQYWPRMLAKKVYIITYYNMAKPMMKNAHILPEMILWHWASHI